MDNLELKLAEWTEAHMRLEESSVQLQRAVRVGHGVTLEMRQVVYAHQRESERIVKELEAEFEAFRRSVNEQSPQAVRGLVSRRRPLPHHHENA